MNDFYFFESIEDQCKLVKKKLEEDFLIKTQCEEIYKKEDIVESVYLNCFREAFNFSWSYNSNANLNISNVKINTSDVKYEQAIFEHCVISALYTVQSNLYNNKYIPVSKLCRIVEYNGHNSLIELEKININENYIVETSNADGLIDKNNELKITKNINKLKASLLSNHLEQTLDSKIPRNDKTNIRYVSLFLSNFSYIALINFDKFKTPEFFTKQKKQKLKNNSPSDINIEKKKYLKSYIEYANKFSLYNDDNKFFKTTKVDKILYYYEKERLLHSEFINYCINEGIFRNEDDLNNKKVKSNEGHLIKECIDLPNVFSRGIFALCFKGIEYGEGDYERYKYENASELLDLLISGTFPIFENNFFVSLFEYCNSNFKEEDTLECMNNILSEYVNNKIYSKLNIDELLTSENQNKSPTVKPSKVEEILEYIGEKPDYGWDEVYSENMSDMYKLLEYAMKETPRSKTYDMLNFKRPNIDCLNNLCKSKIIILVTYKHYINLKKNNNLSYLNFASYMEKYNETLLLFANPNEGFFNQKQGKPKKSIIKTKDICLKDEVEAKKSIFKQYLKED